LVRALVIFAKCLLTTKRQRTYRPSLLRKTFEKGDILEGVVEDFSCKGAKAQSAAAFLRVIFAPLRLCVRNSFFLKVPSEDLSTSSMGKLPQQCVENSLPQFSFASGMACYAGHKRCSREDV